MKTTIHLVMETPGAHAYQILSEATQEDEPKPIFIFPENQQENLLSWKFSEDHKVLEIPFHKVNLPNEVFIFFSHSFSLADQIVAILGTLQNNDSLSIGRFIFFIYSPILLAPPKSFTDWLDGTTHFTDVILFTDRSNDNSASVKELQDRYKSMCYPLESFILSKKNNPWSRILDPSPRRISHVFDDPQLLDPEDFPENDRYLARLASGERERQIPLIFGSGFSST
jgi:hypothetical protein